MIVDHSGVFFSFFCHFFLSWFLLFPSLREIEKFTRKEESRMCSKFSKRKNKMMPRRSIKKKKKENVLIVLSSLRCRCPCRRCSRVKWASRRSATDCSLQRVVMSERRPKTSEDDRRKQCAAPRANNPQSESNPSSYRSEMTALLLSFLFLFFFFSFSCGIAL